jgi:hypothetical protein
LARKLGALIGLKLFLTHSIMPLSGHRIRPGPIERESIHDAMERAASETYKFNPKERAEYVKNMVASIKRYMSSGKTREEIKELLPEFFEQYQNLFKMITEPTGYDESNLTTMLAMLEHMDKGNLTQHGASVIVGKRLYEKYGRRDVENE